MEPFALKCDDPVMRILLGGTFLLLSIGSSACGGCGGDDAEVAVDAADVDAAIEIDAGVDAAQHVCLTEPTFGAATLASQQATSGGGTGASDPDSVVFTAAANADLTPDLFEFELYKGFGVFSVGSIQPGTYTISGAELNYATCGICPRIFTDFDEATQMTAEQQYYATGGTITITSVTPDLTGTVSDLTFEEVTINPTTFESTPVPGGCSTSITSASFDVANAYTP